VVEPTPVGNSRVPNLRVSNLLVSSLLDRLPMPDSFREWLEDTFEADWREVSRPTAIGWVAFYVAFLLYAAVSHGGFLVIDSANLMVHEAGHLLFSYLGQTPCLWGGTIFQWAVPLMLATYFFTQRQTTAFAFSLFFFFENWLYTATYMADARAMELPLVTVGDPELAEHDWNAIFTSLGVLQHDTMIAGIVRFGGWCGMIGTVAWLVWRAAKAEEVQS